jgi:Leucine-rich repeat (LRR) protein
MERWKLFLTFLLINLSRTIGEECTDKREGKILYLTNCNKEALKFDENFMKKYNDVGEIIANGGGNNFPKLNSAIFEGFQKVEKLSLAECKISEITADVFQGLSGLKQLYLENNHLKEFDESLFKSLANLERLYLENNRIEHLDKNLLKHNQNLKKLSLSNNQIASLNPELFSSLINLEHIWFQDNKIKTLNRQIFAENRNLSYLNFDKNGIQAIERDTFKNMSRLEYLGLSGNDCINKTFSGSDMIGVDQNLEDCYKSYEGLGVMIEMEKDDNNYDSSTEIVYDFADDIVVDDEDKEKGDATKTLYLIIFGLIFLLFISILTHLIKYRNKSQNTVTQVIEVDKSKLEVDESGYLIMDSIKHGANAKKNERNKFDKQYDDEPHIYETLPSKTS